MFANAKQAAIDEALDAAKPSDPGSTQFVFSPAQIERDHARAEAGLEMDVRSMSTAGKTTESTRLHLKEAREEIADLQQALRAQKMANQNMETDSINGNDMETEPPDTATAMEDNAEMDSEPTDAQLLGSAIHGKHQAVIHQESDAMEDQEHADVYIGTNDYPPSLPSSDTEEFSASDQPSSSSSSSVSSSSSSDGTHDTNELVAKLTNNQYHALSKSLIKTDKPSSSVVDSASYQSSGQSSESSQGHSLHDTTAKDGVVMDVAGQCK